MPDSNLPKQLIIPTTWLVTFVAGGLLHTGVMYQQFQQMREDAKANSAMVAMIRENQINGLAAIGTIRSDVATIRSDVMRQDERIVVIERILITKGKP